MCGLGVVVVSSIFGLVLRPGTFTGGLLSFDLVSGLHLTQLNCGTCHFFTGVFYKREVHEYDVRTHDPDSMVVPPTPSFSLGVSSLFCRVTQCM